MTEVALIVVAFLVYFVERSRPLVQGFIASRQPQVQKAQAGVVVPPDLRLIAKGENTEWARDQVEQRFRELYSELGSWEAVRETIGGGAGGS